MKKFCTKCLKDSKVAYREKLSTEKIADATITYLEKCYICNTCGEKFYDDLHNYNVLTANKELRKFYGTIIISEIEDIVNKHNVEAEKLSLILGFEKGTIGKYLDSMNPKKDHSELLKKLKYDSKLFQSYLDKYNGANMKV